MNALSALPSWAFRWAVLFALWLALVDSVKVAELITGAVAAAISATAGQVALPRASERARPRLSWLSAAGRQLLRWPVETAVVCAHVLGSLIRRRRPHGRFRAAHCATAPGGPRSRARRAAIETLGSLTPNRYVVGVDSEREYVLVHELLPSDEPIDPLEGR